MGCDKFNPDKYIGEWDFVTKSEHYQSDSISGERVLIGCDTIYYLGTITYTYEEYNDHLTIQYTKAHHCSAIINKHGDVYTFCPKENCKIGKFEGEDKVYFNLGRITPENPEFIVGTKRKEVNNE